MGLAAPSRRPRRASESFVVSSLAGLSHVREGRPNQDAAGAWSTGHSGSLPVLVGSGASVTLSNEVAEPLDTRLETIVPCRVLAVSDGHGSPKYDRSDRGSALAVRVTLNLLVMAADRMVNGSVSSRWWDFDLPRKLTQQWRRSVLSDAASLDGGADAEPGDTIRRYGATLIGALLTPYGSAFVQLGDGDLMIVTSAGQALRPIEPEERQLGVDTESLCMTDAERRMRVVLHQGESYARALVMLTSDGVMTSFVDNDGFVEFVLGVDQFARRRPEILSSRLERGLARCSSFSGDDVTAAIALPQANGDEERA